MPNWCKGVLKVRGKKEDLLNFLNDGFRRYGYSKEPVENYAPILKVEYPLNINKDEFGNILLYETDKENNSWLYFKDSHRCFVTENIEWYLDDIDDEDISINYIDIKQAWDLDSDYFKEISKKYNIDFRILGFEAGMLFTHEIEIIDGQITLDKKLKYYDYEWEVCDPRIGG